MLSDRPTVVYNPKSGRWVKIISVKHPLPEFELIVKREIRLEDFKFDYDKEYTLSIRTN